MNNNKTQYSFATGGFCFHLQHVNENLYKDQTGGEWTKNGNTLLSSGGSYAYQLQPKDTMDNKDFFMESRRLQYNKSMDQHYFDRFEYIHR